VTWPTLFYGQIRLARRRKLGWHVEMLVFLTEMWLLEWSKYHLIEALNQGAREMEKKGLIQET
jgi:hypothetical protein